MVTVVKMFILVPVTCRALPTQFTSTILIDLVPLWTVADGELIMTAEIFELIAKLQNKTYKATKVLDFQLNSCRLMFFFLHFMIELAQMGRLSEISICC